MRSSSPLKPPFTAFVTALTSSLSASWLILRLFQYQHATSTQANGSLAIAVGSAT